jgi:hypothetical protein
LCEPDSATEVAADDRPETVHFREKRIVPLQAVEHHEFVVFDDGAEAVVQRLLLVRWKQEICAHADDQRAFQPERRERRLERTAMFGEVEQVGRS